MLTGSQRLTITTLTPEATQAVSCAAEFVLGHGREELFTNVCYSPAARGYQYDPAFVLCALVGDALFGPLPPPCLEDLYRANTTLLPEQWMGSVSLEAIADEVASLVRPDPALIPTRPDDWLALLDAALADPDDDRLAQAAFPPRSPQDLGIRYVRASDVWGFYLQEGRQTELRGVLTQFKFFYYIAMTNICLAKIVFVAPLWWDGGTLLFVQVPSATALSISDSVAGSCQTKSRRRTWASPQPTGSASRKWHCSTAPSALPCRAGTR